MANNEAVGRPKILVVDDEPQARELAERLLKSKYEVTTANSAEAALDLISKTAFDAALVDYHMPGKDGFAVADVLMSKMKHDKIILVTADPKLEKAGEAISYLPKPYDPRTLLRILEHVLSTETTTSEGDSTELTAL